MVSELDSQTSFGSICTVQAPKKMQLKDFSAFFFFFSEIFYVKTS